MHMRRQSILWSGPKKSRLARDLKATESVKHMFERHNISYTASCDRKAATYQKALTNFVHSKSDDQLKELMNDCYKGVPTDVAFRAEIEYRGRHM